VVVVKGPGIRKCERPNHPSINHGHYGPGGRYFCTDFNSPLLSEENGAAIEGRYILVFNKSTEGADLQEEALGEDFAMPTCTHCGSKNLKIRASTYGEGVNRRMHRKLVCKDCGNVNAVM